MHSLWLVCCYGLMLSQHQKQGRGQPQQRCQRDKLHMGADGDITGQFGSFGIQLLIVVYEQKCPHSPLQLMSTIRSLGC